MKDKLMVVKIGGNIIDHPTALDNFLSEFARKPGKKILVHGGGKIATEISKKLGIVSQFVEGRRVTSAEELEVVTMVYGGLLSKKISAKLNALGCKTLGLSGADAGILTAEKRSPTPVDYGFVGDIQTIQKQHLLDLLNSDFNLAFCALTGDNAGQLLNTNADTIAASLAIALANHFEVDLYYIFEKKGVLERLEDENSVIPVIDKDAFENLKAEGKIHTGMLPKLSNALEAVEKGVKKVVISDPAFFAEDHPYCTIIKSKADA